MDEAEQKAYRKRLLALRDSLIALEEDAADSASPVELDQTRVGRLSRMDAIQLQQMAKDSKRRRQHKLRAIEGALRRLESGKFGACYACGEDIDAERLRVDPTITRCVSCME